MLKPGGHAILELSHAELTEGDTRASAELSVGLGASWDRAWEAFRWSNQDEVLDIFREPGFDEFHRMPIDYPSTHELLVVLLKPHPS